MLVFLVRVCCQDVVECAKKDVLHMHLLQQTISYLIEYVTALFTVMVGKHCIRKMARTAINMVLV